MCEVAIAEDLAEQAGADRFTGVDGDGCDSAIGMSQAMMTALDADDLEADLFQGTDQLLAGESFATGHRGKGQAICTCWTATKVRRGGRGPSARQREIASATRFINTSSDLACV